MSRKLKIKFSDNSQLHEEISVNFVTADNVSLVRFYFHNIFKISVKKQIKINITINECFPIRHIFSVEDAVLN